MFKHQGFSSLALIIIAVLILGGGYWLWQNQLGSEASKSAPVDTNIELPTSSPSTSLGTGNLDTSGWKTYRKENYGVEIRYPIFLLPNETKPAGVTMVNFYNPALDNRVAFSLAFFDTNEQLNTSFNNWGDLGVITIGGKEARKIFRTISVGQSPAEVAYLIERKNIAITFDRDSKNKITDTYIDSILSTFQFIPIPTSK